MLKARVILGSLLIVGLVALLFLDGYLERRWGIVWLPVFFGVVGLAAVTSVHEMAALLRRRGWRIYEGLVQAAVLALLGCAALGRATGQAVQWQAGPLAIGPVAIVVTGFLALILAIEVGRTWREESIPQAVESIAASTLIVLYVGVLLVFVTAIRLLCAPDGLHCLLTYLAVAKSSDIGGFAAGRLFGRHKLNARLSPGKSAEGAVGAVALSLAAALVVGHYWLGWPWWQLATFGATIGLVAILGDLAESLVKRAVGAKDSGAAMPGFGGVLDIIDSVLLTAPAAYGLMLLFGAKH